MQPLTVCSRNGDFGTGGIGRISDTGCSTSEGAESRLAGILTAKGGHRRGDNFEAAAISRGDFPRETVFIIQSIGTSAQTHLLQVTSTSYALSSSFGFGQRRQEHTRQDGNNRDHDQKFNQRERLLHCSLLFHSFS